MKKLDFEYSYEGKMDNEVLELCNAMNSLPGIYTIESCCGHGNDAFRIWFKVESKTQEGLFFLVRCTDRRYWEYGNLWKIELSVGDMFYNEKNPSLVPYGTFDLPNELPIIFMLHSGIVMGEDAYKQAKSLVENMNYHINHKNFMVGYNLNIKNFIIEDV